MKKDKKQIKMSLCSFIDKEETNIQLIKNRLNESNNITRINK